MVLRFHPGHTVFLVLDKSIHWMPNPRRPPPRVYNKTTGRPDQHLPRPFGRTSRIAKLPGEIKIRIYNHVISSVAHERNCPLDRNNRLLYVVDDSGLVVHLTNPLTRVPELRKEYLAQVCKKTAFYSKSSSSKKLFPEFIGSHFNFDLAQAPKIYAHARIFDDDSFEQGFALNGWRREQIGHSKCEEKVQCTWIWLTT